MLVILHGRFTTSIEHYKYNWWHLIQYFSVDIWCFNVQTPNHYFLRYSRTGKSKAKGWFTPSAMKSSQGPIKYVIGCWTQRGTTLVYTKGKKMLEWPWILRSPKDIFEGMHYPLTWSDRFCGGRSNIGAMIGKSKGSWKTNIVIIDSMIFYRGKRYEDKGKQKNDQSWSFSKLPF